MKAIHQGKAQGILCWKLDRLARNPVDGGALIWSMDQGRLKEIVTPSRAFHKSGDDAFWMQLEFGIAKKYVDDLSDNIRRGLRAKANQGEPVASKLPLGYMRDRMTGKVVADPERFPIVQRVWQEVAREYYRPMEVLDLARNAWGLRTMLRRSTGGLPLGRSAFYDLLKNSFYMGVFDYLGEAHQGHYPAMVTPEEFKKVQRILGRGDSRRPQVHHEFAYRGILSCGNCKRKLTAEEQINRYGYRYVYYHCTRHKLSRTDCREPFLEERVFEKQVLGWLERMTLPQAIFDWVQGHWEQVLGASPVALEESKRAREKAIKVVEKQLGNLKHMRLLDHITEEEYFCDRQKLLIEKEALLKAMETEQGGERVIEPLKRFFSFASLAKKRFEEGDQSLRRKILVAAVSNLWVKDRKVVIEAKKPFQLLLDRPQSPLSWTWLDDVRTSITSEVHSGGLEGLMDLSEASGSHVSEYRIPQYRENIRGTRLWEKRTFEVKLLPLFYNSAPYQHNFKMILLACKSKVVFGAVVVL